MMRNLLTMTLMIGLTFTAFGQWVQQATGFTAPSRGINHVHAVSENVVWAAAYDGSGGAAVIQEFTRTLNGGNTWTPGVVDSAAGLELAMIFALNADTAFAPMYRSSGSNPQGIYVTYDGGLEWKRQASADFSNSASFPNVVHFFNANDGFAQGDPVGVILSCIPPTMAVTTGPAFPTPSSLLRFRANGGSSVTTTPTGIPSGSAPRRAGCSPLPTRGTAGRCRRPR